jgi:anti-sigma28 factor (negative regulator of flagellin synthesis)
MLTRKGVNSMLNDIKLDGLNHTQTAAKSPLGNVTSTEQSKNNDGISVSSHLSDMAKTLLADDETTARKLKIEEITRNVNQNQYRVDVDRLAATLANGILLVR